MKTKTLNLALGAMALGLVAVVVVQQQKDEAKLNEPPKKGEPLTALKTADIQHAVLHHATGSDIDLVRKDGRWALTAPVQAPADSVEVGKLLAIATAEKKGEIDVAKVTRSDFGLEPAEIMLTLDDTTFALGGIEQIKYLRYVEVNNGKADDRVALINDPDASILDSDFSDLIAKALLPPTAELTRIELPDLTVEKTDKGWISKPANKDVSQDDLQAFADTWKRASAVRTETPDVPKGGESKGLTAKLTLADGSTSSYLIVNRSPQLILDYAPYQVRYRLPPDISKQMLALPEPKPESKPEAKADGDAPAAAKPEAKPADAAPAGDAAPK